MSAEKIAIVTDSCSDIPEYYRKMYHIIVLPILVHCKGKDYKDGVNITSEDIYEIQQTEMPKTSSPEGKDVMRVFEYLKKQKFTHAIFMMLSGGLSGTVNQLKFLCGEEEGIQIEVFDSKQGSIGIGALAIQIGEYIHKGKSFQEIMEKIPSLLDSTKVFFYIDTLEYLQKGGRIGKAAAVAGNMLQIKPILTFGIKDGVIEVPAKERGKKKAHKKLLELVKAYYDECGNGRAYNIMVADGGDPEGGDALEEEMKQLYPDFHECFRAKIGAALSVYLGKGLQGAGIQFID